MSNESTNFIVDGRAQGLAKYPHAKKVGNTVYVSGISSRRFDNTWEGVEELPDGTWKLDIRAQTRAVIENIKTILEAAGGGLEHLVDVTVFLVDMNDYAEMNEVYNEYFTAENAVKQLPNPRLLIEIKSVAVLPQ